MKKAYRVKTEKDFQRVFHKGQSVANRQFVVYVLEKPGQEHYRVGISVGKRLGNAVTRNAVKRKIRQSLQEMDSELKNECDFLVIARKPAATMTTAQLKSSLRHVLKLAERIK